MAKVLDVAVYQDNWKIDETLLFYPKDIQSFKKSLEKQGLTTAEAARLLGVHLTALAQYTKEGKLKSGKYFYKGRNRYFIDQEKVEKFKATNEIHRIREKKLFYSKTWNLYLYQTLVRTDHSSEIARIMEISNDDGKVVTESGKVFKLSAMEREGFKPKERYDEKSFETRRGYAKFIFDKPLHISSPIYNVIELFYKEVGYRNIRLLEENGSIIFEMKPTLIGSLNAESNPFEINSLEKHIVSGYITKRHNGIWIESDIDSLIIHVPTKLKTLIKDNAEREKTTLEDYVSKILEENVPDNSHE